MRNLRTILKSPNVRFKTLSEFNREYGMNWPEMFPPMDETDVLTYMSLLSGKVVYKDMVRMAEGNRFLYLPVNAMLLGDFLTTRAVPKYDASGDVLKVGMLVKILYNNDMSIGILNGVVSKYFRNEPGTIVRITKVVKPFDNFKMEGVSDDKITMLNKMCIGTELCMPQQGFIDWINKYNKQFFKNNKVHAFEISWRCVKLTPAERKAYYKSIRG